MTAQKIKHMLGNVSSLFTFKFASHAVWRRYRMFIDSAALFRTVPLNELCAPGDYLQAHDWTVMAG